MLKYVELGRREREGRHVDGMGMEVLFFSFKLPQRGFPQLKTTAHFQVRNLIFCHFDLSLLIPKPLFKLRNILVYMFSTSGILSQQPLVMKAYTIYFC